MKKEERKKESGGERVKSLKKRSCLIDNQLVLSHITDIFPGYSNYFNSNTKYIISINLNDDTISGNLVTRQSFIIPWIFYNFGDTFSFYNSPKAGCWDFLLPPQNNNKQQQINSQKYQFTKRSINISWWHYELQKQATTTFFLLFSCKIELSPG